MGFAGRSTTAHGSVEVTFPCIPRLPGCVAKLPSHDIPWVTVDYAYAADWHSIIDVVPNIIVNLRVDASTNPT
jgi:hypothetical protein